MPYVNFEFKYKGSKQGFALDINDSTPKERIVCHLSHIRDYADSEIYRALGIDTAVMDKAVAPYLSNAKGGKPVSALLKAMADKNVKESITKACIGKPELKRIASSYISLSFLNLV